MNSRITEDFLACFAALPEEVREQARRAYRLWKQNPAHPGLHFKRVHAKEPVYSVRVGLGWRVRGLLEGDTITWFWIGSHADYDRLLEQLLAPDPLPQAITGRVLARAGAGRPARLPAR